MPVQTPSKIRCFNSVSRYLQGPGTSDLLYDLVAANGKSAFAVLDPFFYEEYSVRYVQQFRAHDMSVTCARFGGEINQPEIDRLQEQVKALPATPDVFISMGGGKTCDIIKCLATMNEKPVIIMPTALATDAPTSSHSICHTAEGDDYLFIHRRNPEYIVVDTAITIHAPLVTFASGLGDALATYFESMAAYRHNDAVLAGRRDYCSTQLGRAVARLSFDILMEKGRKAYADAKNRTITPEYEDVAEANTILSGLGFENTNCSMAHGTQSVFHRFPMKPLLHGQGVGYCTLLELIAEKQPQELFDQVWSWCRDASTQFRAFLFPDGPLFALREEGGASPYSTITRAVMGSRSALEQYRVVRPMRTAAAQTEDIALAPAVLP